MSAPGFSTATPERSTADSCLSIAGRVFSSRAAVAGKSSSSRSIPSRRSP
jgi:hypothetical protein